MMTRNLLFILLSSSLTGLSLAFDCPANQYPYGGCSSCFTVSTQTSAFDEAAQYCQDNGGALVSIADSSQFELLARYLGGLLEDRQLWVGYRYDSENARVDTLGGPAPAVVLNDENFSGATLGNVDTCVAINGSSLVNVECVRRLPFLCMYTYGVADVSTSPDERIVYVAPSETNFVLSATITTPEASTVIPEWRFNGTVVSSDQSGYIVTPQDGTLSKQRVFSLTVVTFDPLAHTGTYELLVSGLTGTVTVATWQLRAMILGDITIQPQDITVTQGQIAGFECQAENALPSHTVTWYKDSVRLDDLASPRYFVSNVTGTLFIREVVLTDAGLYHCVCENGAGSETSEQAMLTVAAEFLFADRATFLIQPRPQTLMAGQTYSLECIGEQPFQSVTSYHFFYDQSFFHTTPDLKFDYPTQEGFPVYMIEGVTVEASSDQNGCTISPEDLQSFNMIAMSVEAPLIVHSLPEVTRLWTRSGSGIETESSLISVLSGSDVTIQCQFSGVPIPSVIQWTLNGEPVTVGVVNEGNVSTLSVSGVTSGGVYQCIVESMYGRDFASVYVCVEEQESVPSPVLFTAKPNTNTSLYISWSTPSPLSTHPLLLRYEVKVQHEASGTQLIRNPQPGVTQLTVTDLLPGELYRVGVVAMSLLGSSTTEEELVRTFSNPIVDVVSGLNPQRTGDNSALVVQWDLLPSEQTTPILPLYEVEYRVSGSEEGVVTRAERNGSVLVVDGLDNAASFEVRIRVLTQTQRDPPVFEPGPWSAFVTVAGITTLPPSPTPTQQASQPATPPTGAVLPPMGLLLIYILVPVGVLLLVAILVCLLVICCCCKRSRKNHYFPSKIERQSVMSTDQRPMGSQVYSEPINNHINQVWTDNVCYTSNSVLPQATTFEDTSGSNPPARRQNDVSTPAGSSAATPALSVRSGTVTITYLNQNGSSTPSPIPDSVPGSATLHPKSEKNGSLNWNGASANSGIRPRTSSAGTRPQTWTPSTEITCSTYSMPLTTPPPTRSDPFGYVYRETTSAAADIYRVASSIEGNMSHRLSEEYDSLEPSTEAKESLSRERTVSLYSMDDTDFQVLEELAAEAAAMASESGTPDLYAHSTTDL